MRELATRPPVRRRRRPPAISVVALAVVVAAAVIGVVYGSWTQTLTTDAVVDVGNINADFIDAFTDDPPGSPDAGFGKDVASCTAEVVSEEEVVVLIENAYPNYTCNFTTVIQNGGTLPERREPLEFDVPPVLTVTELSDLVGVVLHPDETDIEKFLVEVGKDIEQNTKYVFTIMKPFSLFNTGTIGFWKNWNSHNTFSQSEIETWLAQIDAASAWYGPATVGGMETLLIAAIGSSATPETRFLAQCLATRLDERSTILDAGETHDVTGPDSDNYLGLGTPSSATLAQIIAAIEAKSGSSPSDTQFNIMKDVCDALNNLDI